MNRSFGPLFLVSFFVSKSLEKLIDFLRFFSFSLPLSLLFFFFFFLFRFDGSRRMRVNNANLEGISF